jgi:hypothetical protein
MLDMSNVFRWFYYLVHVVFSFFNRLLLVVNTGTLLAFVVYVVKYLSLD